MNWRKSVKNKRINKANHYFGRKKMNNKINDFLIKKFKILHNFIL